jgi:hypothetical protein
MPNIVSLPDGTYLILNGATQGYAGFGLANNPNLGALLYDPTLPLGARMSILNNTIVARMYHSEAALLPDGRVLVSGSDPQTNNPDGTVKYPEEFRIEVGALQFTHRFKNSQIRPACIIGLRSPLSQPWNYRPHIHYHQQRLDIWTNRCNHSEAQPRHPLHDENFPHSRHF